MDLMTTMMVFFVILWSLTQGKSAGISDTIGDQTVRTVNLPGDVLFASGQAELSSRGKQVFLDLFGNDAASVLNFDTGGLAKRLLLIHGHTDSDGDRDENFRLGYERAFSVYKEMERYSDELPHHVVICTHADNSPAQELPSINRESPEDVRTAWRKAKARNRRITIEDKIIGTEP